MVLYIDVNVILLIVAWIMDLCSILPQTYNATVTMIPCGLQLLSSYREGLLGGRSEQVIRKACYLLPNLDADSPHETILNYYYS